MDFRLGCVGTGAGQRMARPGDSQSTTAAARTRATRLSARRLEGDARRAGSSAARGQPRRSRCTPPRSRARGPSLAHGVTSNAIATPILAELLGPMAWAAQQVGRVYCRRTIQGRIGRSIRTWLNGRRHPNGMRSGRPARRLPGRLLSSPEGCRTARQCAARRDVNCRSGARRWTWPLVDARVET